MDPGRPANPFSSRHVRPGAVDYLFPDGRTLSEFLRPLEENGWTGELVGPEGAGKTTLLHTIASELHQRGVPHVLMRIREEHPRLPLLWRLSVRRARVVLLDSAELLRPPALEALAADCRRRRCGLVITAHRAFGLGLSCRVEAAPETFHALVSRLLSHSGAALPLEVSRQCLRHHRGNARLALFDLYDRWERGEIGG